MPYVLLLFSILTLGLVGCGFVAEVEPAVGPTVKVETVPPLVEIENEAKPEAWLPVIKSEKVLDMIDYAEEEAAFQNANLPIDLLELPAGFTIEVVATNIKNARSMALSDMGTLYVGSRAEGKVYALEDRNQNGKTDRLTIVAENLNAPNGVALKQGDLYVAEIDRILKFTGIEDTKANSPQPEVVFAGYPTDKAHGWKYIAFGPDGDLYVPVGFPCNLCDPENSLYGTITRLEVENGSNPEVVAAGIRNSVGFDWHPETGRLWFTENGADSLGHNFPADELNELTVEGAHFGFPYCHNDTPDGTFGNGVDCQHYELPRQTLNPHGAALGMKFYTGDLFPESFKNQIFIAEHGSWNRTPPIGYQVSLVRLDETGATTFEPFVTGWVKSDGTVWGRPVDILVEPSGALLISDDESGTIYRLKYAS